MILGGEFGHSFQMRQQDIRFVFTRITPRHKDRVEAFHLPVKRFLLSKKLDFFCFVRQMDQDRNPDPVIKVVLVAEFGKLEVHLAARILHQRVQGLFLPGDIFHGIGSEDDHLAEVLFELFMCPRIPAVGGVAIANLMSTQRAVRSLGRLKVSGKRNFALFPIQVSQQLADGEHGSACIVPGHGHNPGLAVGGGNDPQRKGLGLLRHGFECEANFPLPGGGARNGRDGNDGVGPLGPFRADHPIHTCPTRDLFGENRRCNLFCRRTFTGANDDDRFGQIDRFGSCGSWQND